VFNEQVSIELAKTHSEALIQVQLAPTAVYFMPQSRGTSFMSSRTDPLATHPKIQPSGWLTLESLQFRGNGLYSDEEVPWKVEILEYAWLVEVIVGQIAGNIQPEHVSPEHLQSTQTHMFSYLRPVSFLNHFCCLDCFRTRVVFCPKSITFVTILKISELVQNQRCGLGIQPAIHHVVYLRRR
jgi:hypothetical protein